MFNKSLVLILSLCLALPACAETPRPQIAIQVIVDNSAVLAQPEQALEQMKRLFWHLSELRKHAPTRNATITIVSTNYPRNLWIGTASRLRQTGAEVLAQIAPVENGCADLRGAFEQVRLNLRRQAAQEVRVYVFASLIDTGSPCGAAEIRLPQAPPEGLDLAFLDARAKTVQFYWVHPLQVKPWFDLLAEQGLEQRAKTEDFNLGVYDEQETQTRLEQGL